MMPKFSGWFEVYNIFVSTHSITYGWNLPFKFRIKNFVIKASKCSLKWAVQINFVQRYIFNEYSLIGFCVLVRTVFL